MSAQLDYAGIWDYTNTLPWCGLIATGRTGSDAFQSQLDSHPQIFSVHGALLFHDYFWARAKTTQNSDTLDAADIVEEFCGAFIERFRSRYDIVERKDRLGDGMDQSISIDIASFRRHVVGLLAGRDITSRNFLAAVYIGHALALGEDPFAKKIFFHHLHQSRSLRAFLSDFPDARVVAMTRDPRAAYASYMIANLRRPTATASPNVAIVALRRILDEARPLIPMGERFRAMRMEDLSDEATMRQVCDWLGVTFVPTVMKSTWNGLRWWGDTASNVELRTDMDEAEFVRRIRSNNWETRFGAAEKYTLDFILRNRIAWCRYPTTERNFLIHAVITFFVIPLPTIYERRFLAPQYLFQCLSAARIRNLVRIPYHYLSRVIYYYRLYLRALRGTGRDISYFGQSSQ